MPGFSAASTIAANLDVPRLFNQAHWIVKVVMVLLAVMFVVGLYIIIYKTLYIRRAASESAQFSESFWRSRDIEQIYKQAQALRNRQRQATGATATAPPALEPIAKPRQHMTGTGTL